MERAVAQYRLFSECFNRVTESSDVDADVFTQSTLLRTELGL